ncbi:discoidin domain-containing protein [Dactylosporangium salmoneum]|uniref:F5/8 type C domain-containing protein n=1 Tax=Dactylosporangium salmoneum TaxID=53361 RepID=A0ABN3HGI8_9ACTN
MTEEQSEPTARWVDHRLLIPPGWLAVDVPPLEIPDDVEGLLLLGAGSTAVPLPLPVVTPDGPVVVTPGGTLFAEAGWWRHTPDGSRTPLGPRWPPPAWQAPEVTLTPMPAGWLLGTPSELALSVAADPARPRLLFNTADSLADTLRTLPEDVELVPLLPGQGAGRPPALAAAAALGRPVRLVNGVPLHTPAGDVVVHALDAAGHPVWAEPAWLLQMLPDGREEVLSSTPPQPSLRPLDAATYGMDLGWLVRVWSDGLHAYPTGPLPPARGRATLRSATTPIGHDRSTDLDASATVEEIGPVPPPKSSVLPSRRRDPDGRYRVEVGTPGLEINDLLWPPLSALFTAALTDLPAPVDITVIGDASPWGLAAARELADRHPGDTAARPKPFLAAEPLPLTDLPSPAPAAAPPARRRRTLLVAAVVAVLVLLGVGIAAAWPGGGAPLDGGQASGEQHGLTSDPSATTTPTQARRSGSPSPASTRSGAPSASAAPSSRTTGGPSATAAPSQTVANAADGVNLAAGRSTRDSGHTQAYGSGNVTDGDAMSYWESRNGAFPQWVEVDLGAPAEARRAVLRLPPSSAWPDRTQRIEVLGSTDDKDFTSLAGAATYTFSGGSGQRVSVALPGGQWRYFRLVFTANSVQPAGQLSSLELYRG